MRRSPALILSLSFVLAIAAAGCASDGSKASTTTAAGSATASSDAAGGSGTTGAPSGTDSASTDSASSDPAATDGPTTTPAPNPDKPKVSIPAAAPTELKVTELRAGTGGEAASGDSVVLDYVGVRSADGTEFDNSWDRREPFTVDLGTGQVIKGWDQGLVGVKTGGQYQLDIPADLAYGDQGAGDTIKPGDALTFVVDIRQVIKRSATTDQPTIADVPKSTGATEVTTKDLVPGTGDELALGDNVYAELIAYRGDTGEQINTSWGKGGPSLIQLTDQLLPGLVKGIPGMKVGGRRLIVIPAADGFGSQGSSDGSIPANVDLIIVIDAIYAF